MEKIRLDRFLSNAGCGTRTKVKQMIRDGRVQVNRTICLSSERKIDPGEDEVLLDHKSVSYEKTRWFMMNKPVGVITAVRDNRQKTVLDLMGDDGRGLFPAGRLDIDTEGLLLLTDDGVLSHYILSPAHHVSKCYEALVSGEITKNHIDQFACGLSIGDEKDTLPALLEIIESIHQDSAIDIPCTLVHVTISEGRYHQVKRMFEAIGSKVLTLKRISIGSLALDDNLRPGEYRRLTAEETEGLKKDCGIRG